MCCTSVLPARLCTGCTLSETVLDQKNIKDIDSKRLSQDRLSLKDQQQTIRNRDYKMS